jgi:3-oxoacyl-[acyl-carrier-protein] synthase-3
MRKNTKRRIKITGTGFYVPDKILTNIDLEKMVDTSDEWIMTRTGIKERRVASEDQATSDLAVEASRTAIKNAGLEVKDIDLIIVATSTPDTVFPSTACWVQKGLGADLLIGGELLTKVTDWKDRNTCVLFGDAAAAAVLEESDDESGMLSFYWKADGKLGELLYQPAGGTRIPATPESVAEGLHYLKMKGNDVFKHAVKRMGEAALEVLKLAGLKKEDIDYFIPHQANIRIIDATGRRLKVPPEKVYTNIHKYGNVSVASIPIGVHELWEEGRLKKGNIIIMDAFGAGFTWAAVAYRW